MKFFFDNNLSVHLVKGLKGFGENVMHLQDKFEEDEADEGWLTDIGQKGLFLITRDDRVRFRPAELEALKRHRVGAFFLGGKNLTRCQLIQQIVRNWPAIKEYARKTTRPFAFRVRPSGGKLVKIPLS